MISDFKNNFICGRKFQLVSDVVIDTGIKGNIKGLKNKSIIWCKTDFIKDLFNEIRNDDNSYILITHNSDYSIGVNDFLLRPKCIKKWFAQNVDFLHGDLIALPIGLENDIGPSKGLYTDYDIIEQCILKQDKRNTDGVYCNFNVLNCSKRNKVIDGLVKNHIAILSGRLNYGEYCSDLLKCQFVASPRGNGIDCHRTWEALYLGCIPIVEKHFMYDSYDLPIVQVEDWNNIDINWLGDKEKWYKNTAFSYEKLDINYWLDKIKREQLNDKNWAN